MREYLATLTYPLYFLDYETILPVVPLFDNSRPYQQIPFQFSLHIQEEREGDLSHVEFLHIDVTDPRPAFVRSLIDNCGEKGSVIVYNQSFEAGINSQLAMDFPQYGVRLDNIASRMVDLLVPFRARWLHRPEMPGSASLKSVPPAFVPDLSYGNLAIGDGETASLLYLNCSKDLVDSESKKQIFEDLREYCALDTLAEVKLLKVLYGYA